MTNTEKRIIEKAKNTNGTYELDEYEKTCIKEEYSKRMNKNDFFMFSQLTFLTIVLLFIVLK